MEFGKPGFFGYAGGACEFQAVAVGVGEGGDPEGVADLGLGWRQAAFGEIAIESDSVFALEGQGDAYAYLTIRGLGEILEH